MPKQTKFTRSARGEECQVRMPGICNSNPETTILAHLPDGSGTGKMGGKSSDLCSTYACSSCHDEIDGRTNFSLRDTAIMSYAHEGHMRTLRIFVDKGLLKL